jgi:hypothetical protein
MTLPKICPLGDNQTCKGPECHLFCLEWRMREPICLIGYSTTSKLKSEKADQNKDTYAEDTFRMLSGHPVYKKKHVYEKGDWIPTRLAEESMEKPAERKYVSERGDWIPTRLAEESIEKPAGKIEDKFTPKNSQRTVAITPGPKHEKNNDFRPNEMHTAIEAGEASLKLEARMKKEPSEENPSIFNKTQPEVLEKLNLPEKVVSINKDTTIFISSDTDKKKDNYPSNNEENTNKEP